MAEAGGVSIDEERFNLQAVQNSLEYVKVLLEHGQEHISAQRAFAVAIQIEESMLERKFFEAFQAEDEEARGIIRQLIQETGSHLERVRRAHLDLTKEV